MRTALVLIMAGLVLAGPVLAGEHPEHPKAKTPAAEAVMEGVGALDGKVFVGEIGMAGEEKGDKDEFVFKNGKFVSTACVSYGFNAAPYVATEKDGVVSFTVKAMNDDAEAMKWKGVVKNGEIEGTAVYETEEGKTEYWFKGRLKPAGSASKSEHPEPRKSEHPEHPR